jgi:uncharacterized membrane protein
MKQSSFMSSFRVNFLTGLAVVLPGVISIGLLVAIFGTVSNFTDHLLFFLPHKYTHDFDADGKEGAIYWYCSLAALILAVFLVALIGKFTRYYIGRQVIAIADHVLMSVPLLNKIYSTLKQVNEAFSNDKSSFKQVVLIPFPNTNLLSIGFVTGEHKTLSPTGETLIGVFIPTTPNPTSGFLVLARESEITRLDMSVADGIKYIISLGAIVRDSVPNGKGVQPPQAQSPSK